jgi:hypothetical protein
MCVPAALAGAAVVGGVVKGVSDKMQADASASAQRRNAVIAEQAAQDALDRGDVEAGRIRMKGAALQGAQRAGYAAAGVVAGEGSAGRTEMDTVHLTEMDAQTARNNAQREAWGLEKQAENMRASADATETAGWLSLGGDIIGGAVSGALSFSGSGKAKAPGVS